MTESVLQQQAAKCREAQKNLDSVIPERNAQLQIIEDLYKQRAEFDVKIADAQAKFNEINLIHDFAQRAVALTIEDMHRTLRKANPYGEYDLAKCATEASTRSVDKY